MPKMGESIIEATILRWVKNVGDTVEADETILEIATDKVDSEVPSPVSGVITEVFYQENDVVAIGKVIANIATEGDAAVKPSPATTTSAPIKEAVSSSNGHSAPAPQPAVAEAPIAKTAASGRFYSPLVRTIAEKEQISLSELERIEGTGMNGRVTKKDVLSFIENRTATPARPQVAPAQAAQSAATPKTAPAASLSGDVEIIEMDRMRKIIAEHMVMSKQTSPHVTSFVEVDVTNIVKWRERNKKAYQEKYGENITYTPIFIEAVARAIGDYPMVNISVDGTRLIRKKNINIGMATALPSGNLIVPVIKNADRLNLAGLTKAVNDLAARARNNQLRPEEIQDGTFTITNVGVFGNIMGTPIINQPQVAILAVGSINKKPAVVETPYGDLIAIRHMMFLSLSYDHRVVDGFLGGSFLRRIGDYLQQFDADRAI